MRDEVESINSNLGTISSVSVNIKQIANVNLSDVIKNDAIHGKMKIYAFWNVSGNPFSFSDGGYCLAFYNRSLSPSVWLIGFQSGGKVEIATIGVP